MCYLLLYMAMIYHFNNYFSQTNMGLFPLECIHKFLLQRELEDLRFGLAVSTVSL